MSITGDANIVISCLERTLGELRFARVCSRTQPAELQGRLKVIERATEEAYAEVRSRAEAWDRIAALFAAAREATARSGESV